MAVIQIINIINNGEKVQYFISNSKTISNCFYKIIFKNMTGCSTDYIIGYTNFKYRTIHTKFA